MIVVALKQGYLSKDMDVVTSVKDAESFDTKKQAQRKVSRVAKKRPDVNLEGLSYEPSTRGG